MGLDIHKNDVKRERLLTLDDKNFNMLSDIFSQFYNQSGIKIDRYKDCGLSIDSQKHLIKVIDDFIRVTDLNRDKKLIIDILSFRGFLAFTIAQGWALMLYCD